MPIKKQRLKTAKRKKIPNVAWSAVLFGADILGKIGTWNI